MEQSGDYALFTQHLPEEFELQLLKPDDRVVIPQTEHRYASPHEHDERVGSVGIRLPGELDKDRFEGWMVNLLRRKGVDIYRMKGIISLRGEATRFVFQGVHMLFDGQPGRPWQDNEQRASDIVFIGRRLDREFLETGLRACLA
jgi:G3E family GTPase